MVMERVEMNKNTKIDVRKYEVWMADLNSDGSVQGGRRPVVIVSNNLHNKFSPTAIIVPTTGSKTKRPLPTHVDLIASETGFIKNSVMLCEQITSIDKERLKWKITDLPLNYHGIISKAVGVATSDVQVY